MAGDNLDHFCPRDGSLLIPPEDSDLGAYLRYGAYHCDTCAGMLLNSKAAESTFCVDKLNHMHEGFTEEGTEVDLDCPFCDSHMRVRKFSFQKIDGKLTEPIEIDGCPVCASFWLDAGELQKLSPPVNGEGRIPRIEANALAVVLEVLLQLPIILL